MKSLRKRMSVWFAVSFVLLAAAFTVLSYRLLRNELVEKSISKDYPDHPEWRLHGNFSESEVADITKELTEQALLGTLPLVAVALLVGWWLARQSLSPIARLNRQLRSKTPSNLGEPLALREVDAELRDLLAHLNDLLARLDASFREMNDYAAKVSHELRTPLAILRLKLEQAGDKIPPDLGEEMETELHHLTHVVEQALLVARADQGSVVALRAPCDVAALLTDLVGDFQLLASEQQRLLSLVAPGECWVLADVRHLQQVFHNLLTNALKHGWGDLTVRIRPGARPSVVIVNRVRAQGDTKPDALGLGLRVVGALMRLDPEIHFQRRRGRKFHAARLVFSGELPAPEIGKRRSQAALSERAASVDENYFI